MKEKISSDFTFLRRFSWVGFLILLLIILFFSDLKGYGKASYVFAFSLGVLLFFDMYFRLMDVEIDEHFMYVTYGEMNIQIPFTMIKNVRELHFLLQKPIIVVELKAETKIGLVIKFVPRALWGRVALQHPIVGQLKKLAKLNHDL
ncbi:MAG: hypothetical protein JNM55_15565 [Anaerolineales bacterium]|nr:hypothetical protein [Anaerolineales bacterium]